MSQEKRKILIFETQNEANHFLLERWQELADDAIATRGRFAVALSGGRSPINFYNKLNEFDHFDVWMKTHIFLSDERFVPFEDGASNYGMIRRNLAPTRQIPDSNFHPIPTACENVLVAAEQYKNILIRFFAYQSMYNIHHSSGSNAFKLPQFDFCLLGIGEDGHTASLYPQTENLDDPHRWTIPISHNHLKHERVSLTLSVFNEARFKAVLAFGENKAPIIKSVLENQWDCPAARLNGEKGELLFLLDRAAASQLSDQNQWTKEA